MQLLKKAAILLFFLFGTLFSSYASHYMGGEITWKCRTNGKYDFTLKLYRECNGITYSNTETLSTTCPGVSSITMTLMSQTDISPVCGSFNPAVTIHCLPAPAVPNTGAVEEWLYSSLPSFPDGVQLTGVPPASGWVFSHSSCCRNPCTNINGADSYGWFLRALMYPYQNRNAFPCYDSSPQFAERPSTVITSGWNFNYNHVATDAEQDELSYSWAPPLDDGGINDVITNYATGYTFNNPMPNTSHNSNNIPATIDPVTGEITYLSYTTGAFVTVTKVTAYKCGIKVAEIFREMQVVLIPDPYVIKNNPPTVTAPFYNSITHTYDLFRDTIYAGDLVSFLFRGFDNDKFQPNNTANQTMSITATGSQFASDYINTNNCLNPPCATLNPPPPINGQLAVQTFFRWQSTCDHLSANTGCGQTSNVFNFLLKVTDNACPAPGKAFATVTLVVIPPPVLPAPVLRSTKVLADGRVTIDWKPPIDTMNTFYGYKVYKSNSLAGPYILIDSIFNLGQTSYTTVNPTLANSQPVYFYFKTMSGCGNTNKVISTPSDTICTMYLKATNKGNQTTVLQWNPIRNPNLPNSSGIYNIKRSFPVGAPYVSIGTTNQLTYTDLLYSECSGDSINYIVETTDLETPTPFTSISSIDVDFFGDNNYYIAPPSLRCASVRADGTIDITWVQPVDTFGVFKKYYIYYSTSETGPFSLLDSIANFNTTTYHHIGINGQTQQYFYNVNVSSGCSQWGFKPPTTSNILGTMMLTTTNLGGGVANINWGVLSNPLPATTLMPYTVIKEYPAGTWINYTTTNLNSANDTIYDCNTVTNYKVSINDASGCTSTSSIDGDRFGDASPPDAPIIDSVSVLNANNDIIIGWTHNTASDVVDYTLYKWINGIWDSITTIHPMGAFVSYLDTNVTPDSKSEKYCIAAWDNCRNLSLLGPEHQTILLNFAIDRCKRNITLNWTDYINMKPGGMSYEIYYSVNSGPYTRLASLASNVFTYAHNNVIAGALYSYYIKAVSTDGLIKSTSNDVFVLADVPKTPEFVQIRAATVYENEYIKLRIVYDSTAYITQVRIFRADFPEGPFNELQLIDNTTSTANTGTITYDDHDAFFNLKSYYYKAVAYDSCKNEIVLPDDILTRTIFLTVEAKYDMKNVLSWNDYEGWHGKVLNYKVYRKVDDVLDQSAIIVNPSLIGQNSYIDDVSPFANSSGKFAYYVEAVENVIPPFYIREYSYSNEVEVHQLSRLFIPNAFVPNGENTKFLPINVFVEPSSYHLSIYNRFGSLLFETKDVHQGWDGTYKGNLVQQGVYAYHIKFSDHEGNSFQRAGTVTLIR